MRPQKILLTSLIFLLCAEILPTLPIATSFIHHPTSALAAPVRKPSNRTKAPPTRTKPNQPTKPKRSARLPWLTGARQAGRSAGAFARSGQCENTQLTALVPPSRPEENIHPSKESPIDLTLSSHPTFWVNLANTPKNAQIQFTLQNATGTKQIYRTEKFTIDKLSQASSGLLGIKIPINNPGLAIGETYRWQMLMNCDPTNIKSHRLKVSSWVKRITPNDIANSKNIDLSPLEKASTEDKIDIYAQLGIWYDTLTSLIELKQEFADDPSIDATWQQLFTDTNIDSSIKLSIIGIK